MSIKEKADYKLVDLRDEKQFNEYHIPGAQNIKTTELVASGLQKPEKIVLYSESELNAAQAWFLLKAKNYKAVYVLSGGINAWKDKILFPRLSQNASKEELAAFEKVKEVSLHFGGMPQSGLKEDSVKTDFSMPKLVAPVQTAKSSTPRKKKEGC